MAENYYYSGEWVARVLKDKRKGSWCDPGCNYWYCNITDVSTNLKFKITRQSIDALYKLLGKLKEGET
jgi:hypothetical protein